MPQTRLIFINLGYGDWNTAWYCDGVNDDGTLVNAVWTQNKNGSNLHDSTHKYIFIAQLKDVDNILFGIREDGGYANGLCVIEENFTGKDAIEKSLLYDQEVTEILSAYKAGANKNSRYNIKVNGDYGRMLALFKYTTADVPLVRHIPYFEISYAPLFNSFINLCSIDFGGYGVVNAMFADCLNLEEVRGFEAAPTTYIPKSCFANCGKLKNIELPAGVTFIDMLAFYGCTSLALTELPAELTDIEQNAFANCKNLEISSIPSSVTKIDHYAFMNCEKITVSSLPEGCTFLGQQAFDGCKSITKMTFPSTLEKITASAISNTGIKELICKQVTPPSMYFANVPIEVIRVPSGSVDAYKEASFWKLYADKIVAIE